MDKDIIIAIIQLLMIPLGWIAVHHLSGARERKIEWRKLARDTILDIEKIEEMALSYHKSTSRDDGLAEDIYKRLEKLDDKWILLTTHFSSLDRLAPVTFRQAITLRNFDSSSFRAQSPTSSVLKRIMAKSTQLISQIYSVCTS